MAHLAPHEGSSLLPMIVSSHLLVEDIVWTENIGQFSRELMISFVFRSGHKKNICIVFFLVVALLENLLAVWVFAFVVIVTL